MDNSTQTSINASVNLAKVFNSSDMKNICLIDKKIGDVNGDNIPDTVYLIGEKRENPFYENIKVMIQDGRTMQHYVIPLQSEYSMAYNPWLFLGSFTHGNVNEIMVNLPVGGSGGLTFYYVLSFFNNLAEYILEPEAFMNLMQNLEVTAAYMDDYKVLIKSDALNQSHILDISDKKEIYEGTVYNEEGKLIKPLEGFIIDQPHLNPVRFDGDQPYKLEALQEIAGTSHADRLGYIVTYWTYSQADKSWILEPEMFFVMY